MVEVSEVGLKEEEVELDLGLSIGGSFGRSEKQPVSKVNGFGLNLKEQRHGKPEAVAVMDPQTKRKIQALRRLEARKKRDEKQHSKRVVRESDSELDHQQRFCKREKTDGHNGRSEYPNENLNLNDGEKQLGASAVAVGSTASFQQPYAYVQLNNGYAYPCLVPWTVKERNAGQPAAACKGFRPYLENGYRSNPNGERVCGDNKKAKSDGSSMCSSSVVSDHPSSSHEGGGSSDSQSQSVQSLAEPNNQLNGSKQNNMRSQLPEQTTATSHPSESDHTIVQQNTKTKPAGGEKEEIAKRPPPPLCHEKPPRPHQPHMRRLLAKMPYVSTAGNGPNGKRVNGFLYRYNSSEVSIVCVCHGNTFTPAGFVQHAGGTTDISHPERHITVINPPAFDKTSYKA